MLRASVRVIEWSTCPKNLPIHGLLASLELMLDAIIVEITQSNASWSVDGGGKLMCSCAPLPNSPSANALKLASARCVGECWKWKPARSYTLGISCGKQCCSRVANIFSSSHPSAVSALMLEFRFHSQFRSRRKSSLHMASAFGTKLLS